MAYQYIEATNLDDALHDSETYMEAFYAHVPELQRITRGRPGKVPAGKPKTTDGTIAGMRREMPKQIIQKIPSGSVIIKNNPDMQDIANGVLTDIILPHANSGGTPFSKAKRAIRANMDVGSAWAECFFDRTGDIFHANYKLKHYRDILFAKGKVSEFDTPYMPVNDWLTEFDIKAILWQCKHIEDNAKGRSEKYNGSWKPAMLQKLLSNGAGEKPSENMTDAEKKAQSANAGGYFRLVKFYQIGVKAQIYTYAPAIKEVVRIEVSKDPRGIIPVHGLVLEDDDETPLGEPLAAISAPKQNLLDFDMQMYQYGQGMGYSPAVKKWGTTPAHKVKIVPDAVIEMSGTKDTDDFEVVNINNSAIANYSNNASYIKTQIYNEQGGSNDTSVSGSAGAVGYSKTDNGVKQLEGRVSVGNNDSRQTVELWHGRIFETCLNIQFAESKGKKEIELEPTTMKRYKLEKAPTIDYDKDYGKIRFVVDASSSEAADNDAETEKLVSLQEIKSKYAGKPDEKFMLMYNQIVQNAGVDDPDKLLYTDDEIAMAKQINQIEMQLALKQAQALLNPPPPQPAPPVVAPPPMADPGMPVDPAMGGMPPPAVSGEVMPTEADVQNAAVMLKSSGKFSDAQIAQGLDMIRQGADDAQVMQMLMGAGV